MCYSLWYNAPTMLPATGNIKYIKRVLWRVVKRLSYIEEARCLKVNPKILPFVLVQRTRCNHWQTTEKESTRRAPVLSFTDCAKSVGKLFYKTSMKIQTREPSRAFVWVTAGLSVCRSLMRSNYKFLPLMWQSFFISGKKY